MILHTMGTVMRENAVILHTQIQNVDTNYRRSLAHEPFQFQQKLIFSVHRFA